MSSTDRLLLLFALGALLTGCSFGRVYVGSKIRKDPSEAIVPGTTTKGEVLSQLGPPAKIVRQFDGDVFVYQFVQRNSTRLRVREPVITKLQLLTINRVVEKADRLVVLFDDEGTVCDYGYAEDTDGMKIY